MVYMSTDEKKIVNEEIAEYYAMINHFILLNNKEEIAFWRRALQTAKIAKRRKTDS